MPGHLEQLRSGPIEDLTQGGRVSAGSELLEQRFQQLVSHDVIYLTEWRRVWREFWFCVAAT